MRVFDDLQLDQEEVLPGAGLLLLDVMKLHFGDSPAFPHLRQFGRKSDWVLKAEHFSLFLQPNLSTIDIHGIIRMSRYSRLPTYFDDHFPVKLVIRSMVVLAPAIEEFTIIRFLGFRLTGPELCILAGMQSLKRLSFCLGQDGGFPQQLRDKLPTPAFPALQHLDVLSLGDKERIDVIPALTELLQIISSTSLQRFTFIGDCLPVEHRTLRALFVSIASFHKSLDVCDIHIRHHHFVDSLSDPVSGEFISTMRTFSPLLSLRMALLRLILGSVPVELTGAGFASMLSAWPNLVSLQLGDDHPATTSTVSLNALATIVDNCPKLETLYIKVRCPDGDALSTEGLRKHLVLNMLCLQFHAGRVGDVERTAAFLAHLFPRATLNVGPLENQNTYGSPVVQLMERFSALARVPTIPN